jgi:hypothetical protein
MPRISREQAELAIFERFNSAYMKRFGYPLVDIEHQDRPDFIAVDPILEESLGIEITGVYQDSTEARIQYWDVDHWGKFTGSIEDLIKSLNCVLEDKSAKSWEYKFDGRLILGILMGSLVFNEKIDIDFIRNEIVVPENAFTNIWLILSDRSDNTPELYDLQ